MYNIIILIIIILLVIAIGLACIVERAFKKAFTKHKKTEEEAYQYLKEKNILDKEIYTEINREEVYIKSKEGFTLKGYLIEKYKKSNRYIILVHGFTANNHIHMAFARFFINEGFNILVVDQRNHGCSEGDYPSYGYFERDDIDRWIDYLYSKNNKKLFLGLHGQSLGGATVLLCGSKNNKVDFIIEDCGYSSAKEEILWEISKVLPLSKNIIYKLLRNKVKRVVGFDIDQVNPIEEIVKCNKPIMFIHGSKDKLVPCKMAKDMYYTRNNVDDELFIVEDADHMWAYPKKKKEYESKVHHFINKVEKMNKNNNI